MSVYTNCKGGSKVHHFTAGHFNPNKFGIVGKIFVSGTIWNEKVFEKIIKMKMNMKKKKMKIL